MKLKVNGENPFKVRGGSIAIAPTTSGYTINYSVDGQVWTADQTVPANENLVFSGLVQGVWMKLAGNADNDVLVMF